MHTTNMCRIIDRIVVVVVVVVVAIVVVVVVVVVVVNELCCKTSRNGIFPFNVCCFCCFLFFVSCFFFNSLLWLNMVKAKTKHVLRCSITNLCVQGSRRGWAPPAGDSR